MIPEKKFIGFDLGAESGRCIVARLKDRKLVLDEVHRFRTHNIKYENGFHWDILAIYEEIIEGLTSAQKAFGPDFDGIGVDTWGVDYVLVDPEGRILGYPYHYRDDRTDEMMNEAFKILDKEQIYDKVGIQFAQYNTLFQLLSETKKKLNLLIVADKMLLIPDFLNFMLSGKKKAEFSIASTTSLANPITRNWSWELIDTFGLPRRIFPEMVEPGKKLGRIIPSIAEKTGLNKSIPIFASAGHDTASAVVSVPACDDSWAFLSSGTWSLMGTELNHPIFNSKSMKYNFSNEGGVEGTTRFLKNIVGLWPVQECRRYWLENSNEYNYQQLTSFAKEAGFVKAWVNLNDQRFLKPDAMPGKVISFLNETNQTAKSNAGFIVEVILESLAFTYKKVLKEIEETTGNKIEKLNAVGGGIQNEYLMQMAADAIGRKVIAGPIEGTIVGNIGVQAIASGVVANLKEWRSIVANSFQLKIFEPINTKYFCENETNFERILK